MIASNGFYGTSIAVITQKKRRGPVPTGKGTLIGVRLQPPDLPALDKWIAQQPEPKPSRPEAIRHALRDWLINLGLLKHRDDPEGANGHDHPKPVGPATDAVKRMDKDIAKDKPKRTR